jgi:hypothetical protein
MDEYGSSLNFPLYVELFLDVTDNKGGFFGFV